MKFTISKDTPAQKLGYAIIEASKRGTIIGKLPIRAVRLGGEMTNKQFMEAHGLSSERQASKVRNHRIPMPVKG